MSLIPYPLRGTGYADGSRRPWVAEIRGHDEKYEYARRFLRPARDWAGAGKRATAPAMWWYHLKANRVYEAHRHVKGAKTERVYLSTAGGVVAEIDREAVETYLAGREKEFRRPLGVDVFTAARSRIAWVFDTFQRVSVSFSGGKDSTVLLHLAAEEARRRRVKIGVLFVDWEAQFTLTADHVRSMLDDYADVCEPHWVCLPLTTVNACSQIEPEWVCWDERKRAAWVRQPPEGAVTDQNAYPFYRKRMTFEEFAPAWGRWYAGDKLTAHFVGLRAAESLNRFRALIQQKAKLDGRPWTTWLGGPAWNAYPLYDWKADDIWTYTARESKRYNGVYDLMHRAGLTPHQMRIDEPFGDETRRGLWLYQILEPDTWARMVARVAGAGTGNLYCREKGAVLGIGQITKPDGVTWREFSEMLLDTMPPPTAAHYRAKIAVWRQWWANHHNVPADLVLREEADGDLSGKDQPTYRRICKVLLANDYWCKGLGFSPTKGGGTERYQESVRKKMAKWSGSTT